jgi:endonuclease/exonuclease/phosphatase family metal-dependent hydrolase
MTTLMTWNAQAQRFALQNATHAGADIIVLQECPRPPRAAITDRSWTCFWDGEREDRGLLVAVRPGLSARLAAPPDPSIKYALAVTVDTDPPLRLLGVHIYNHRAKASFGASPTPLPDALDRFGTWLAGGNAVIAGDFNNQPSFESIARPAPNRWSRISARLAELGLVSAWHTLRSEAHGAESVSTHHKSQAGYHIDYVFASPELLRGARISIGDPPNGSAILRSDHSPIWLSLAA